MYIASAYALFNIAGLHIVYPTLYNQNPVAKTLSIIQNHSPVYSYKNSLKEPFIKYKSERYAITQDYVEFYNPGYNFYLKEPVIKFTNTDSLQAALSITRLPL